MKTLSKGTAAGLLAALLLCACAEQKPEPSPYLGDVELLADKLNVRTGSVGTGRFESQATYVLIDAKNTGPRDLLVTLRGKLIDASDREVGALRAQSIRIPAGGMRMFALVDTENTARPDAKGARVEVVGAIAPSYEPPVQIEDGRVNMDSDKAVAQGYVVNTAQRRVAVIVIGGFYDADHNPVEHRSTKLTIDGGEKRGIMLAGPPGSKSGYLFIGEYAY